MTDVILVRYGEIALKGKNRKSFERKLVQNIKHCLRKNNIKFDKVFRIHGRILVYTSEKCPMLSNVAGIVSFSYAKEVDLNLEQVKKVALNFYKKGNTFKIQTNRLHKVLKPSPEISKDVGVFVCENANAQFEMMKPDQIIGIEVDKNNVYVYSGKEKGMGGLPAGIEGACCLILEDENSVEAGILVIKRGCSLVIKKINNVDYSKLKNYAYGFELMEVNEIPTNVLGIVVNDTLNNLKDRKYRNLVLRPLAK